MDYKTRKEELEKEFNETWQEIQIKSKRLDELKGAWAEIDRLDKDKK